MEYKTNENNSRDCCAAIKIADRLASSTDPTWHEVSALLHDWQMLMDERDRFIHLIATLRDKGNLRFGKHKGLLAFSDLKEESEKTYDEINLKK